MICEIRFLTKNGKYDKTLAKIDRECNDLSEALRYAAATLNQSTPEEQEQVSSVRLRVLAPGVTNV